MAFFWGSLPIQQLAAAILLRLSFLSSRWKESREVFFVLARAWYSRICVEDPRENIKVEWEERRGGCAWKIVREIKVLGGDWFVLGHFCWAHIAVSRKSLDSQYSLRFARHIWTDTAHGQRFVRWWRKRNVVETHGPKRRSGWTRTDGLRIPERRGSKKVLGQKGERASGPLDVAGADTST